jgi:hypothetical protein
VESRFDPTTATPDAVFPSASAAIATGSATTTPFLYVCDSGNNRIQVTDYEGNPLFSFGSYGSGNGEFSSPYGVANDGERVYVSDTGNHRVQYFDIYGNYLGQWGTFGILPGEFNAPKGIATNGSIVAVIDQGNNRFQIFSPTGYLLFFLGEYGDGSGPDQFNAPTNCYLDDHFIWIDDTGNTRIVWYLLEWQFGGYGSGELPAMTGSGTGVVWQAGRGTGVLPNLVGSGSGSVKHVGSGIGVLPAMEGSGTGKQQISGSGSGVLPAITGSGTGRTQKVGSGLGVLPAIISSGSALIILIDPTYAGVAVNMRNKAITEYAGLTFNSLAVMADGNVYGANAQGIFKLSGADDNGTAIAARIQTGRLDLHRDVVQQLVDIWLTGRFPGAGVFTIHEYDGDSDDASEYEVVGENGQMHDERVDIAQGHEGRFVALEYANVGGADFDIKGLTAKAKMNRKRRR